MDTKKVKEINKPVLDNISAGVATELGHTSTQLIENHRSAVMKELLQGLSYGPSAPECTDATR